MSVVCIFSYQNQLLIFRRSKEFQFSFIFTKAHESSTRILDHDKGSKGQTNGCHHPRHGKTRRLTGHKAVRPTGHRDGEALDVIGRTKGMETIIDRWWRIHNRKLVREDYRVTMFRKVNHNVFTRKLLLKQQQQRSPTSFQSVSNSTRFMHRYSIESFVLVNHIRDLCYEW